MQVRLKLETIRADVDEFGGKAYRMSKANKDDAVVALLKDQLDEFKQVCCLPVTETRLKPACNRQEICTATFSFDHRLAAVNDISVC